MNVRELEATVRGRLNSDTGSQSDEYWSSAELIDDYANAAINRLFQIVRKLVIDSTTAIDASDLPLCRISLVAGTATYAMSQKILSITRMKLASQTAPIGRATVEELDNWNGDWQNLPAGNPFCYCTDLGSDSITFVPPPSANDTASLVVLRYPLSRLTYKSGATTLGFREEYHDDIIPWILHLAFSKQDSEIYNPGKAEEYRVAFERRAADIKLELHRQTTHPKSNRMLRGFMSR